MLTWKEGLIIFTCIARVFQCEFECEVFFIFGDRKLVKCLVGVVDQNHTLIPGIASLSIYYYWHRWPIEPTSVLISACSIFFNSLIKACVSLLILDSGIG